MPGPLPLLNPIRPRAQVQGSSCITNMEGKFSHALWLSSRAASTLGFDEIRPNPDCTFTNICVMGEVRAQGPLNHYHVGFARRVLVDQIQIDACESRSWWGCAEALDM